MCAAHVNQQIAVWMHVPSCALAVARACASDRAAAWRSGVHTGGSCVAGVTGASAAGAAGGAAGAGTDAMKPAAPPVPVE